MSTNKKTSKKSAAKSATTTKNASAVKEAEAVKEKVTKAVEETKEVAEETQVTEKTAAKKEKAPAKKTAAKKADVVQEVFVEYGGNQILMEKIVADVKDKYVNEGHYLSSIKSLRVYVNLEERKAYYVINDKPEDKFVQF